MISIQNLGVEFSARPLFSGISAVINATDKVALVGKNGAGKSTLLKIIAGLQQPSEGTVARQEGVTIGYLPQQMNIADETSVINETRKVFDSMLRLKQEEKQVSAQLAERTDYDSPEYHALIERLTYLNERLDMNNSFSPNPRLCCWSATTVLSLIM